MLSSAVDWRQASQALAQRGWSACGLSKPLLGLVGESVVSNFLARLSFLKPVYLDGFRLSYSDGLILVGLGLWPFHLLPKTLTRCGQG